MHRASSLLRFLFPKIVLPEFLYGVLLVLSRCCFHHLVENSILYKKRYTALLHSTNTFFSIIRSVAGGKVDGQILLGARSEKFKILFGARGEKWKNLFRAKWHLWKILFGSQRVQYSNTVADEYKTSLNMIVNILADEKDQITRLFPCRMPTRRLTTTRSTQWWFNERASVNDLMSERTNVRWMKERTNELFERLNEWTFEQTNDQLNEPTNQRMNEL